MEELTNDTNFKSLIGLTVQSLWTADDHRYLCFVTDNGNFWYYADGDCCSYSWFNHLDGLDRLIGRKITNIIEKPSSDVLPGEDHESVEMYGWTFVTDMGYVDLEMRNSSNGYYGGSIVQVGSGRNVPEPEGQITEVKEDF